MSFSVAVGVLHGRPFRTEKSEEELIKFKNNRLSHAYCALRKAKVSKGRHGSSVSESNYYIVLKFLNDGKIQLSVHKEKPHTLVKDSFQRQDNHVRKLNQETHDQKIRLDTEKGTFNVSTHKALVSAIDCLGLSSHEKFKSRATSLSECEMVAIYDDHRVVRGKKHTNATPKHYCKSGNEVQYDCQSYEGINAFEEQCEYSLT